MVRTLPFIGRAAMLQRLSADRRPLLTLVGHPGVGKSRLANELARSLGVRACYVDVAAARSAADIIESIARAAGTTGDERTAPVLVRALGTQSVELLVLDNIDLAIDSTRLVVEELRAYGLTARIMVTARGPLGLSGESVEEVPALGIEDGLALMEAMLGTPDQPKLRLRVNGDVRWFEVQGGERVSLQRRGPVRLLFKALIERHQRVPGSAATLSELFAAGWPGQRTTHESGAARVYVALATLRRLGLRPLLQTRDDGYLIDPTVAVEVYSD